MSQDDPIIIEELPAGGGKRIGHVVLNAPRALNSLSLEMIEKLQPRLQAWEADDDLVCVFIEGAGDRAFCAGGDIIQIYKGMTGEGDETYPDTFFTNEYRLDYTLHTLKTPVIAWGDGIIMGGGLGIFAGASHRVATENARLAMPEISIGLFPDVGGTWFLNRMPGRTGLFLGLTGAQMNAGDALFTGLADRFMAADNKRAVLDELTATSDWKEPILVVDHILRQAEQANDKSCPQSHVRQHLDTINQVCDSQTLSGITAGIRSLESNDDSWLAKAAKTHASGCPVTAHLVYQQIQHGKHLSLKQCFLRELKMAFACIRNADFREGVRALLIDKDGKPNWTYQSVAEVPAEYVAEHFVPRWEGGHPLADLVAEEA